MVCFKAFIYILHLWFCFNARSDIDEKVDEF